MISRIAFSALLFVLACSGLAAQEWRSPEERPGENGRWLCWEYSSKGQQARTIDTTHSLEYFTKNISDFDTELAWRKANDKLQDWSRIRTEIKPVGNLAGQQVMDIFYYPPNDAEKTKAFGKMVVIGSQNRFRPVVWIFDDTEVHFSSSQIITVQGVSVLSTRTRIDGTGNFHYEDYFVFDRQMKMPVNLQPDSAIEAATKRLLPAGHGVWKGGGFDLAAMTYKQAVWKNEDSNCCPSGGDIELHLQIKANRIVVTKASYRPARPTGK
jgi:hypothetical protein